MELGGMLTDEMRLQGAVQHIVYESALARTRDARHHGQSPERNADVDTLKIVLSRAAECDPARAESPAIVGQGNRTRARNVLAGQWALAHAGHRPRENDLPAG